MMVWVQKDGLMKMKTRRDNPKSACGQPEDYWRLPNPDRASEFIGCFWVAFDAVGRQVGTIFNG